MSELRKANTALPYFVTMTVVGWIDVFTRKRYCDMVIDSFKYCQKHKGLKLYAYVIMPSHIHIIISHDESKLPECIRDFKKHVARKTILSIENETGESRKEWLLPLFKQFAGKKRQNPRYQFWQKTNYPIVLDNPEIMDQKLEYIHQNPVKAGIVEQPESYLYSSACAFQELEVLEM